MLGYLVTNQIYSGTEFVFDDYGITVTSSFFPIRQDISDT